MRNYSDFFELGITNVEFAGKHGKVTGSFTVDGKRKVFTVDANKNYMDTLYTLLVRSIRKDKLKKLGL